MENADNLVEQPTERKNILQFLGKGSQLFAIDLVNAVLTIITLSIYYPWAKAKKLKYMYQHTSLADSRFDFLGTGKEIFRGYIKALLIIGSMYGVIYVFQYYFAEIKENEILLGIFIALLAIIFFFVTPLFTAYAIYGTYRYRCARSTWRGILFGFRADKKEFVRTYFKGYYFLMLPLVIVLPLIIIAVFNMEADPQSPLAIGLMFTAFALYLPMFVAMLYAQSWLECKLYHLTYGNMSLGDLEGSFKGKIGTLFGIHVLGGILSGMTFGIYYFWYKKNVYDYVIQNTWIKQGETEYQCKSSMEGGGIFKLEVVNAILLIFTLGLAYSWTYARTARYITSNIIIPEGIDVDRITQTQSNLANATGEEMADILDMDMGGIFF